MTCGGRAENLGTKQLDHLLSCQLEIPGNLEQQTGAEVLARVHRNNGGTTIGMLQKHVAPALPGDREASTLQSAHHLRACN